MKYNFQTSHQSFHHSQAIVNRSLLLIPFLYELLPVIMQRKRQRLTIRMHLSYTGTMLQTFRAPYNFIGVCNIIVIDRRGNRAGLLI